ncbi:N-acetylglucosamine-binding protein GbpA [Vibrio chagasii]|uniref:N-acetylglucosamine-binding protein GbpA n=1 Tax=Vibrio chagasii TaxID=170679 RepID=UPI0040689F80
MNKFPNKSLIALALFSVSGASFGHGYVSASNGGVAESRVALCKFADDDTGEKNTGCGNIQWEPQSVEGFQGFPEAGPSDGNIASAEVDMASALDEQRSDRWVKSPIQAGSQNFEWTFTANHSTRDWKYYITKADWNPNQPLVRDSFNLTPFCTVEGEGAKPPMTVIHSCNVPEREGYQVILAVWDVADTDMAFYNMIDVKFDGDAPALPDWNQGGFIYSSQDLNVGDSVYTRVFDHNGENVSYSTELVIDSKEQGDAKNWSHALATKINQDQSMLQAGQPNAEGTFTPVYGTNPIYLKQGSGLESVEIGYNIESPAPEYNLEVHGLESEYIIGDNATQLDLTLEATGDIRAEMTVYNHHSDALSSDTVELSDNQEAVTMTLSKSEPGHHMLVVVTKDLKGNLIEQNTHDFHLVEEQTPPPSGEYDFIFPDGLDTYTAGTKVLASDGAVYQCKEFPYSGYCIQWSSNSTQFEPGVGSHWSSAWNKLN